MAQQGKQLIRDCWNVVTEEGVMGVLRDSVDPDNRLPSSILFGSDFPDKPGILLDDIVQRVIVRRFSKSSFGGEVVDHFHYDEWRRANENKRIKEI